MILRKCHPSRRGGGPGDLREGAPAPHRRAGRSLTAGLAIGLVPLFLTSSFSPSERDCPSQYLGVWEYRQQAGEGYDPEGERLELSCVGGSMRGLYFGLEREGEHGLFYTLVQLPDLKLAPNGDLTFTVPGRELFYERPKNLQEVDQKSVASAGFTRDELRLRGRLKEGRLVLGCTSAGHSCPEAVMVFRAGKQEHDRAR